MSTIEWDERPQRRYGLDSEEGELEARDNRSGSVNPQYSDAGSLLSLGELDEDDERVLNLAGVSSEPSEYAIDELDDSAFDLLDLEELNEDDERVLNLGGVSSKPSEYALSDIDDSAFDILDLDELNEDDERVLNLGRVTQHDDVSLATQTNEVASNYGNAGEGELGTKELAEEESSPIRDFLANVWGTVIGDWNNQSDPMQDMVNMGAGLIPVVDQVLDVRDLAAHLYYMVFEKDYNNSTRWLGLGLTAVGAIPFAGSIVKGLGKLAIFQGGARAVASNAAPILDAIRRFNPEWADIGKLRAAIDSNWDSGVTTFKESWQNLLGDIQGTIANIPTPPAWVWGLGKLREVKNEVLDTISQIQQMSNQMLDDALGRIYQEINAALDELALMVRGSDGELVPAGAGNPSRMETEPPIRGNEPMQSWGNQTSGNLPRNTHLNVLRDLGARTGEELIEVSRGGTPFEAFENAREMARVRANLGDDAVPFLQEIGPHRDNVFTGTQSSDGFSGWRIDFDPQNPEKGFHVNWWFREGPKRRDGWYSGAITIEGGTQQDYWEILNHFPRREDFIGE